MATVGNGNCHTWIRNAHGDWSTTGLFYIIQKHGGWFYYRWWLFVGPYHQIPQKRNITRTKRKSAFGGLLILQQCLVQNHRRHASDRNVTESKAKLPIVLRLIGHFVPLNHMFCSCVYPFMNRFYDLAFRQWWHLGTPTHNKVTRGRVQTGVSWPMTEQHGFLELTHAI